jgi:hypothetical protein
MWLSALTAAFAAAVTAAAASVCGLGFGLVPDGCWDSDLLCFWDVEKDPGLDLDLLPDLLPAALVAVLVALSEVEVVAPREEKATTKAVSSAACSD